MKDITYYQNLIPGILIINGTLFDKKAEGFSYSTGGKKGGWSYIKSLDFFDDEKKVEKIKQDLIPYLRHLELKKTYPYLHIAHGAVWVASTQDMDSDGTAIHIERAIKIFNEPHDLLKKLNEEAKIFHEDPKKFFFCTNCAKAYLKEPVRDQKYGPIDELVNIRMNRYGDAIWSGVYCDICIEKDISLKAEIKRSKTDPNYYD